MKNCVPRLILLLSMGVATALLAIQALGRYWWFASTLDFGFFCNAAWKLGHGWLLSSSDVGVPSILGDHLSLILIPVGFLYRLLPFPETLLILQVIAVTSGAIPIYYLAYRKLGSEWLALLGAFLYLLYPPLNLQVVVDFRPEFLAVPALLWLLLSVQEGWRAWTAVTLVVALSCKEVIALLTAAWGIGLLFHRQRRRWGLLIFLISGLWFLVGVEVLTPWLMEGKGSLSWEKHYGYLGASPLTAGLYLLTHPIVLLRALATHQSILQMVQFLAPLGFLPLLHPQTLLPAAFLFTIYRLEQDVQLQSILFYRFAPLESFLVFGSIFGLSWMLRRCDERYGEGEVQAESTRSKRLWQAGVALGLIAFSLVSRLTAFSFSTVLPWDENRAVYQDFNRQRALRRAVETVPRNVIASATSHLIPHISNRRRVFQFPRPFMPVVDRHRRLVALRMPPDALELEVFRSLYVVVDRQSRNPLDWDYSSPQLVRWMRRNPHFHVLISNRYALVAKYHP